jgi:hypothetical protein
VKNAAALGSSDVHDVDDFRARRRRRRVRLAPDPLFLPLSPIVAWVKRRAADGLLPPAELGVARSGAAQALAITLAARLRAKEAGGALPIDAPVSIACAIRAKLARAGVLLDWGLSDGAPCVATLLDAPLLDAQVLAALACEEPSLSARRTSSASPTG